MYHVYSTMTNGTKYVKYRKLEGPHNIGEASVLIKGGTGVHHKNLGTPLGVHTAVSPEDYEWLKDDPHFRQHIDGGYIAVRKDGVNPEVAAAGMKTFDRQTDSCPIVPQEFQDEKPKADGLTAIKPVEGKRSKVA